MDSAKFVFDFALISESVVHVTCVQPQANREKQRLEHKQRAARKAAEEGNSIEPRWFVRSENAKQGDELIFKYNGEYWKSRDAGRYEGCRDIFGH